MDDPANNGGGLRIQRTNSSLIVSANIPAPPFHFITGIARNPNGTTTLSFFGAPNQTYRVEALVGLGAPNWTSIGTNTALSNGTWKFTDSQASNYSSRFYRSVAP